MTVADAVAQFFAEQGIAHAFGIIGSGNARIFDAIHKLGVTEIVCNHHEQAAAMAATAYWRVCRKLAPVLVTTGAGSANVITGVLAAWMDSIPLLVVSSNEASATHWKDRRAWGVQGFDSISVAYDICKEATRLRDPHAIRPVLDVLRHRIVSGRPGPAWIDIPTDIQAAQC
jgi:acetolactate synthase-1/2/3 large subunit